MLDKEKLTENIKNIDMDKIKKEHSDAVEDFSKLSNKELGLTLLTFGLYFLWKKWKIKGVIAFVISLILVSLIFGGNKHVDPFIVNIDFESVNSTTSPLMKQYGMDNDKKTNRNRTKIEYKEDGSIKIIKYGSSRTNQLYKFNIKDLTKIDITEQLEGSKIKSGKLEMTLHTHHFGVVLWTKPDATKWQTGYQYAEDFKDNRGSTTTSFIMLNFEKEEVVDEFIEKLEILNSSLEVNRKVAEAE